MNSSFTPLDLIWIKNVTRADGGSAYMDSDNHFVLHFPTSQKTNARTPSVGDIIIIHQKINSKRVFSHLVSPLDNELITDDSRPDHRYGRNVQTIAVTPLNNLIEVSLTQWKSVNFQGISVGGNVCKIENISSIDNPDPLIEDVWNFFIPFFTDRHSSSTITTSSYIEEISNTDPDLTVTEGKLKLVSHFRRERNREIVCQKKKQAIETGNLKCEACNFSFIKNYNIAFIECHHIMPISQTGKTNTRLEDLALVCANCHRMLHKKIDGEFLSIKQLRNRINRFAH